MIDGLIGYSLSGAPRGMIAELIQQVNRLESPILSLDVPSGLDAANGVAHDPVITADATLTLALPKHGLRNEDTSKHVGELYLADISVPPELYLQLPNPLTVSDIFSGQPIVRVV